LLLSRAVFDVYRSLLSGCAMAGVILLSRRFHINPDNVATPIAASLGDLTTICLLAAISMLLFRTLGMLCLHLCFE